MTSISVDEYRRLIQETKRQKYGNVKTEVDGILFASKLEADRYRMLRMLHEAKIIHDLTLQPAFVLQEGYRDSRGTYVRPIRYIADFSYVVGEMHVVEDTKGRKTPAFAMKEKLFRKRYPEIDLRIVTKEDVR